MHIILESRLWFPLILTVFPCQAIPVTEEIKASRAASSSRNPPIQLSNLGVQALEEKAGPAPILTLLIMNEINIQF